MIDIIWICMALYSQCMQTTWDGRDPDVQSTNRLATCSACYLTTYSVQIREATVHNHNYWNITRLLNICFSWTPDVFLTFLFIKNDPWCESTYLWYEAGELLGTASLVWRAFLCSFRRTPHFSQSFPIWKQKVSNSSHRVLNEMQRSGGEKLK
jgi:hypothetical protein